MGQVPEAELQDSSPGEIRNDPRFIGFSFLKLKGICGQGTSPVIQGFCSTQFNSKSVFSSEILLRGQGGRNAGCQYSYGKQKASHKASWLLYR